MERDLGLDAEQARGRLANEGERAGAREATAHHIGHPFSVAPGPATTAPDEATSWYVDPKTNSVTIMSLPKTAATERWLATTGATARILVSEERFRPAYNLRAGGRSPSGPGAARPVSPWWAASSRRATATS